jgi:hypothetical protein
MTATQAQPGRGLGPGRFALWGALGFGLGGVLCGLVQAALNYPATEAAGRDSLMASVGFGVMGLVGGLALGLAERDGRAARRFVLTGVLGFGVGGLLALLLVYAEQRDLSALPPLFVGAQAPGGLPGGWGVFLYVACMYLLAFMVRGVIGGAVLGLAVPHRHAVRFLAFAGGLGFGLGGVVGVLLLNAPWWNVAYLGVYGVFVLWLGSTALVGGAVLGAAVGMVTRAPVITGFQ